MYSAQIEEPALQERLQPWVEIECYQLSDGRILSQMDTLDLGSLKIVRESQHASIQKLGITPPDFCTLSISAQSLTSRFSELRCEQTDTIFFLPGNVEFDIHVPCGGLTSYIGFSQKEFLSGAAVLNPALWERPPSRVVSLTGGGQNDFKDAVDLWLKMAQEAQMRGEAPNPAVLSRHLLHTVLQIAATAGNAENADVKEPISAVEIGRKARSFVDQQFEAGELPTLVDICAFIRVSERTLRYAFQEYVGLSPIAYLRACRLNRVRKALTVATAPDSTVTQIAMHYGFMHLGRFASDYRRMFDQNPSETLAN